MGSGATSLRVIDPLLSVWVLLDEWQTHLSLEMTETTRDQYDSYVLRFFRLSRTAPGSVSTAQIERFLVSVSAKGSNRQAYISALKSFFRFMHQRGYRNDDPSADLHTKGPKYPTPDFFRPEEVRCIVMAAAEHSQRHAWAVCLLLETGARVSSLAAVEPRDVMSKRMRFRVVKNDRPYSVVMSPLAVTAVAGLLEIMKPDQETLVGVAKTTLALWFRDAARDAGMPEGRVHAHLARHTAATVFYRRTKDPVATARYLGHANTSQVMRYAGEDDEIQEEALSVSLSG